MVSANRMSHGQALSTTIKKKRTERVVANKLTKESPFYISYWYVDFVTRRGWFSFFHC